MLLYLRMITFPNIKINLGLNVTGKRTDGYHYLESVFYPVPFTDVLEIIPSGEFSFQMKGIQVTDNVEDNLCVKAYRLMEKEYSIGPVAMILMKSIPAGAGMGGGSSDASHVLLMLNEIYKLKLTPTILEELAARLGSDCPFFIHNKPLFVSGRGEILEEFDFNLKGWHISLVFPGIHISTKEAFSKIKPAPALIPAKEACMLPMFRWKDYLKNDFEDYAIEQYPELENIKQFLYKVGAEYASMSGSGSGMYAISKNKLDIGDLSSQYKVWQSVL